jgi:hypothetical protein
MSGAAIEGIHQLVYPKNTIIAISAQSGSPSVFARMENQKSRGEDLGAVREGKERRGLSCTWSSGP